MKWKRRINYWIDCLLPFRKQLHLHLMQEWCGANAGANECIKWNEDSAAAKQSTNGINEINEVKLFALLAAGSGRNHFITFHSSFSASAIAQFAIQIISSIRVRNWEMNELRNWVERCGDIHSFNN